MSLVHELMGNYPEAIAALEEELVVLARDWNTTEGETADAVRREIARLRSHTEKETPPGI